MPVVQIHMGRGRTTEQKRVVAQQITDIIAEQFHVSPDMVTILFSELEKDQIAKAGVLFSDT